MPLISTSPPAVEPLSLAEAKLHLRVDDAAEDTTIGSLIVAARRHVEQVTGLALIQQGWSLYLDRWPGMQVVLPLSPLIAIADVWVYGEDDVGAAVDAAHWFADNVSRPPRLVLRSGRAWPRPGRTANGIEIAFSAGFGASPAQVPQPLRQAMLRLIAHWFDNRGDAAAPQSAEALLQPYRGIGL